MNKILHILFALLLTGIFFSAASKSALASGTCQSMETIGCGGVDSASTAGFVNNITTYNCAPTWNESGPEYVYSFVPQGDGQVTVTLSLEIADLDVFVLEGTCDQNRCIAYGDSTATFSAVEGTQYYIVVDGYAGESGNFTLSVACEFICEPMSVIDCGDVDSSSTEGLANKITTYNCAPTWNESGPEYVYSFVPQGNGQVTAEVSSTIADLDVFVLEGTCGKDSCIAYGDSSATFGAVTGTQYYIVVDGYAGESGSFTLAITCSGLCGAMENISCGQIDTENTQGLSNNITTYNCAPTWNESGPEYVYLFVPQSNGQATAELFYMTADLDVFVLEGTCSQDSCIAYGDSSATFNAVSGTQYYIVVDGFSGESGTFTLEIICSNVCNVKLAGDINGDCYVNFTDMALLANNWLKCNNAMDAGCTGN